MKASVLNLVTAVGLILLAGLITCRDLDAMGSPVADVAEFVVTSPRDAGPGTLRDAILAADRLTGPARIAIKVERIPLQSALPPLINPHGIRMEAAAQAVVIDAGQQSQGPVLQINSPGSVIRGVRLERAHALGVSVNATGVVLEALAVSQSKSGILVNAAAVGCRIHAALMEDNETGLMVEPGVRGLHILGSIFRNNTRAGAWLVGAGSGGGPAPVPSATAGFAERIRITDSVFDHNGAGVVLANQPTLIQKSRFLASRDYAVLVLAGAARVQDSEIRDSVGAAISINSSRDIHITRNELVNNAQTAILLKDSNVTVEHNILRSNGAGIVALARKRGFAAVISDNLITASGADAITLIGTDSSLQRNQLLNNHGAGIRILDLVDGAERLHANPQLLENVLRGNVTDQPLTGAYRLASEP